MKEIEDQSQLKQRLSPRNIKEEGKGKEHVGLRIKIYTLTSKSEASITIMKMCSCRFKIQNKAMQ